MATAAAGQKILDWDLTFFNGMKSDVDPAQLGQGYVWSAINMINLGGVLSCRPGHRCLITLPDGNLQGATIFRPDTGLEEMMVAIDGVIYVASYPFLNFSILDNVQMSPHAKQIYWALTTQSVERVNDDFASAVRVFPPKKVMMMQDGGDTAPAWYDGSNSGHVRDHPFGTPAGGPMCWVGDRLWVAYGNQLFASDIANPFSFREQGYLGGVSAFFFSGDITAMTRTPSIESPQLMVFTGTDGSIVQANNRSRDSWLSTPDFQREVVQVGCLSQRSIVSHYGNLVWFSPSGVAIYDPATSGKLTSRLPIRDNEMLLSKTHISEDVSLVAAGVFGQFLMMSVPAEDSFNKHTWVMNHASLETLADGSGPSWAGYWTGTRPVEWVHGQIGDVERIYHVSVDMDGKNRLWESFQTNRLDNGCPIEWAFSTRGFFGPTAPQASKMPGSRCRLGWANIALAGVAEDTNIGVFYAGGTRGAFRSMLSKLVSVAKGSLSYTLPVNQDTQIFGFKPQARTLTTEDVNQKMADDLSGACSVERADIDGIDESFQLLVVGHGPATVRWLRVFGFTVPEEQSGAGDACVDETGVNALRYDGVGVKTDTLEEATIALATAPADAYESNKTVMLSQAGYSAIGVGAATSIISQDAADRVANIIATKQADRELQSVLPPVTSSGKGFED